MAQKNLGQDVEVEENTQESLTTDSLVAHRKQLKRKKQMREEQSPSVVRDVVGWVAILGSIAWLLILISYDPTDPSAINRTNKMVAENYLGVVGANIAAYSYQFFGFGNFAFPLSAIYLGFLCIRPKKVNDWFFQIIGGGTVIFVFLIFLGSFSAVSFKGDTIAPGGLVGVSLWRFFSGHLNAVGTYLFLIGITGLALLVTTQLTLRQIGAGLLQLFAWSKEKLASAYRWISDYMEMRAEKRTRQRIIERELDKIESDKQSEIKDWDGAGEASSTDLVDPKTDFGIENEDLIDLPLQETDSGGSSPGTKPANAAHKAGIKVNKQKAEKPDTQGAFQFVQDMEGNWVYPTSFHFNSPKSDQQVDEEELREKARALQSKFGEFNVTGNMREIHPGPVVTTYEFSPDAGIKYSKIVNLSDDLCLALGAESIRIDRMPGRSSIGMEVPNNKRELITFREMIESDNFKNNKAKLMVCLGKTIDGSPFFADLSKMPHLLIAGQTGSGKSVGLNALICSILMRARPDEVKLILIDPKMVEMGIYADIPHLLTPVVTDPMEASNSLKWAVDEMERRYRLLAAHQFRNLEHYNRAVKAEKIEVPENEDPLEILPLIVVIIDEMADLMMVARGEVEESIARLAQKSRAIGIHLVLATQRPSVDIITGVIKSNLPSRLAYRVAQRNDSRIILDTNGADKLLGKGDALFLGPGTSRLVRIHAPFLSESEVLDLVKFLKNQGKPVYNHKVLKSADAEEGAAGGGAKGGKTSEDPMYDKAARLVVRSGQASVSYLQRKLSLGYARAAKLVDMMEEDGIVGPNVGSKARDILVSSDFFDGVDNRL